MAKRSYELAVKVKGAKEDFGLGVGILATKTITFDETEDTYQRPIFIAGLMERQKEFVEEIIECIIEEAVADEDVNKGDSDE